MFRIYLADLTHNYQYVANETMPLGVAYIKTYLEHEIDNIECEIFRYPNILMERIQNKQPDVLMLSNYAWNESLSLFFLDYVKKLDPGILTVMGGPNLHLELHKQENYMRKTRNLDIYIWGEGEKPSVRLIRKYLECDRCIEKLRSYDIDSCIYIKSDGAFYKGEWDSNLKDIDEIPSPWLSGDLDEFFDSNLAPIMETARGCPFTCTFCVQGTDFYRKIRRFPLERLGKEVDYIGQAIKTKSPSMGFLCLADSNFGMFKQDVEYSKFVNAAQAKYNWPTYIDATTGKNKKDTILETVSNLNGALVMYNSVQSLTSATLDAVKRRNIDIQVLRDLQKETKRRGIETLTETILSLPGESFESHRKSLYEIINMGIRQFTNYQCMILKGAELETDESRKRFNIETRWRLLPRNWGMYDSVKIFEIEEVVSSTDTLPFSDYLKARKLHLVMIVYYNGFYFEPLMRYLQQHDINIETWLDQIFESIDTANDKIKSFCHDFLEETRDELFESKDACQAFYTDEANFQRLKRGEKGGNLIMKYRTIATFHMWNEIVKFGFEAARKLLFEKKVLADHIPDQCLKDIELFMLNRVANGHTHDTILESSEAVLNYDFNSWIEDNFTKPLRNYKLEKSLPFRFQLNKERFRIIKNALSVYGEDIVGMAKMCTRIQYSDLLKDSQPTH